MPGSEIRKVGAQRIQRGALLLGFSFAMLDTYSVGHGYGPTETLLEYAMLTVSAIST